MLGVRYTSVKLWTDAGAGRGGCGGGSGSGRARPGQHGSRPTPSLEEQIVDCQISYLPGQPVGFAWLARGNGASSILDLIHREGWWARRTRATRPEQQPLKPHQSNPQPSNLFKKNVTLNPIICVVISPFRARRSRSNFRRMCVVIGDLCSNFCNWCRSRSRRGSRRRRRCAWR